MTPPPRPRGRLRWSTLVKAVFLVAAVAFAVAFLASNWGQARVALTRLSPAAVVLSVVLASAGQVTAMLSWRATLADLGHPLSFGAAARVFYLSQLGKYVPGSVWQLAALMELGRRHDVARRDLAVSGVLSLLVSLTTAAVAGGLLLLMGGVDQARHWLWVAPIVVVLAVVALHPRLAGPVVDALLRLLRRAPLDRRWTEVGVLRMSGWQTLTWLLYGGHCWALVVGMGAPAAASFVPAVGGFAVAYAAGTVFLPAPAGAGVREAVLGAALAGLLDGGAVVVVVLLSRMILTVVDAAFGLGAAALSRGAGRWSPDEPAPH